MLFVIDEQIRKMYPGVCIGVVVAKDVEIAETNEELENLRREILNDVCSKFEPSSIAKIPEIKAWREIYRSFGVKPSDYRSSVEALLRRVVKSGNLPNINSAVDLYNLTSIKYLVPIGGYDLDKIQGNIYLRFAKEGDMFTPLGTTKTEVLRSTKEVVYADDNEVICRMWNYRDSEKTKINIDTKNIIFFIDGAPSFRDSVVRATNYLADKVKTICMARTVYSYVVEVEKGNVIEI